MTMRNWGILLAVYALFFSWYTSFGGPLSGEEIDGYLKVLREAGAEEQRLAVWQQFMESDTGDDFAMLNTFAAGARAGGHWAGSPSAASRFAPVVQGLIIGGR